MRRAWVILLVVLFGAAYISCNKGQELAERPGNPIPACDQEKYLYQLPSESAYTTQTLHTYREGSGDERNSWFRLCEGNDLHLSMELRGSADVAAADKFFESRAGLYDGLGEAKGHQLADVSDEVAPALAVPTDRLVAYEYGSWPYLAEGPAVAKNDGFGERDGVATIEVIGRIGPNVFDYRIVHNKIEVLLLPDGWFAMPPIGAQDYLLKLAKTTLSNWPR